MSNGRDNILFYGNSNPQLAASVANGLQWKLGESEIKKFSDGETAVKINTHVREADAYVFQSTSFPANDHLMEMLIMADAIRRSGTHNITAIIPYFGYARQDRRPNFDRVPITARLVANFIQQAGIDQIVTCDLHTLQIQGFFEIPVINASSIPTVEADIWRRFQYNDIIIVSPDVGGVPRARALAKAIDTQRVVEDNTELAIIDKRRPKANESEVMNIIGDVAGRECVIFDDLVDTAGTLCKAAAALKRKGATGVHAYATHAVLSGNAINNLITSELDSLTVTDTIPLREEAQQITKIRIISIAELLTETVSRVATGSSVSALYEGI